MNIKKVLSSVVTFAVLLLLSSATLVSAAETEAVASSDSTKAQLTEEQLEQINMVYFNRLVEKEDLYSKISEFALADINDDGIMELFGSVDSTYSYIYTFADGKIKLLLYKGKYSEVKYHSNTGVVEVDWADSQGIETDYYKCYQGDLKLLGGSAAVYDFNVGDYSSWLYVIENQYVDKTRYDIYTESLIDSNNPNGNLNWIKNTEANRNLYLLGKKIEKKYYCAVHSGIKGKHTEMMKAYIKNGKIYIKGCVRETNKNWKLKKYIGSKKKTKSWKLKKGCKIIRYVEGGPTYEKVSKKVFNRVYNTKEYIGREFWMTVEDGKVVKIVVSAG